MSQQSAPQIGESTAAEVPHLSDEVKSELFPIFGEIRTIKTQSQAEHASIEIGDEIWRAADRIQLQLEKYF